MLICVIHFYRLWLGGEWRRIADEHFAKLREAEFPGQVLVSLIGDPETRAAARALLPHDIAVEADTGFEDVTLRAMQQHTRNLPGSTSVLYAHNKGSFHPRPENHVWREDLTRYLVTGWRERVTELKTHDVAAWRWLLPGAHPPGKPELVISLPIAGGNFWWARADYLKGLPELPLLRTTADRMQAESWLGLDNPAVACESNEWPTAVIEQWWPQRINGMLAGHVRVWMSTDGIRRQTFVPS
jgi:hypothetical protein